MKIFKIWSPVNRAWLILFGTDAATASLLRIVNTREEADALLAEWGA
jgi:hypothetical protein